MSLQRSRAKSKKIAQTGLLHMLFWAISFYILLNIFASSSEFFPIDFVYTGIFLASIIIPVYLNLYILIPRYLHKGRYVLFGIQVLTSLLAFSYFNHFLFQTLIDFILPGYYFISYYSYLDIAKFFASFFAITILLKLAGEWFQLQSIRKDLALLEKEKMKAELTALTNQVNPHFLFNSLNVLYSLAVRESAKTPEAILSLSDLLRYVIYDSNTHSVEIGAEIEVLKKYIGLQKYRVDKSAIINIETEVANEKTQVAPMLFLPLLENAFKHGLKKEAPKAYLNVLLRASETDVFFKMENNKARERSEISPGGVGLANIRNRLKLLYPERHRFTIDQNDQYFRVEMVIELL